MDYARLVQEIRQIRLEEVREEGAAFFECVFHREQNEAVRTILVSHFGEPLKPAEEAASPAARLYSEPYGGVRRGQTFYLAEAGELVTGAMLWPWSDGSMTTLKIFQSRKAAGTPLAKSFWQKIAGMLGAGP